MRFLTLRLSFLVKPRAGNCRDSVLNQSPHEDHEHRRRRNAKEHAVEDSVVDIDCKPRQQPGNDCRFYARS